MEQHQQRDVEARIHDLVHEYGPGTLVTPLRALAREELGRGYPRDSLLGDLERVRRALEAEDLEGSEDDVMTVMDFLTGWCAPSARL